MTDEEIERLYPEFEVLAEEVLTVTGDKLGEWSRLVQEAAQVKNRISIVHQMMRDDDQRPSQYRVDYDMLWSRYQEIIHRLREINPEPVDPFRDKVAARVNELEIKLHAYHLLCDAGVWNPGDFDDFEELLAFYERLHDQALALR